MRTGKGRTVCPVRQGESLAGPTHVPPQHKPELSPVLYVTLILAANGLRNSQIAVALDIPLQTVKSRMQAIYRRLGVTDRAHAVSTAHRLRILSPESIWGVGPRSEPRPTPGFCRNFPDSCGNIITVEPDPPHHFGGIKCGCDG